MKDGKAASKWTCFKLLSLQGPSRGWNFAACLWERLAAAWQQPASPAVQDATQCPTERGWHTPWEAQKQDQVWWGPQHFSMCSAPQMVPKRAAPRDHHSSARTGTVLLFTLIHAYIQIKTLYCSAVEIYLEPVKEEKKHWSNYKNPNQAPSRLAGNEALHQFDSGIISSHHCTVSSVSVSACHVHELTQGWAQQIQARSAQCSQNVGLGYQTRDNTPSSCPTRTWHAAWGRDFPLYGISWVGLDDP